MPLDTLAPRSLRGYSARRTRACAKLIAKSGFLYIFAILVLVVMRFVAVGRHKRKEKKIAALGDVY